MKDCNGNELKVGDRVVHSLAKHVERWSARKNDHAILQGGRSLLSHPLRGSAEIKKIHFDRAAELGAHISDIPIFIGEFLELAE